jgi:hypothetical protein
MHTNYHQDTIGCAAGQVSAKSKTAPLFRSQGTSSQELVCSRVLEGVGRCTCTPTWDQDLQ